MKYSGGCHCGRVRFDVEMEFEKAFTCSCAVCQKMGTLLVYVNAEKLTLHAGETALTEYSVGKGKKLIHHYFCKVCGISPWAKGTALNGQDMRAINIRCLDTIDLSKIPVVKPEVKSV